MQNPPPKYQSRLLPQPEKTISNPLEHDPLEHDPLDHEEEPHMPAMLLAGTCYAKLYTSRKQLQCDCSHSWERRVVAELGRVGRGPSAPLRAGSAPSRHKPLLVPQRLGWQNPRG